MATTRAAKSPSRTKSENVIEKNGEHDNNNHNSTSDSSSSSIDNTVNHNNNSSSSSSGKSSQNNNARFPLTWSDVIIFLTLVLITVFTYPHMTYDGHDHVPICFVWYYGWITAISTGLGALPFFFFTEPDKFWMGVSNAVAGGMMIAASYSLVTEGIGFDAEEIMTSASVGSSISDNNIYSSSGSRTMFGFICGVIFLIVTKRILDMFGDVEGSIGDIVVKTSSKSTTAADLNKMFLIIFVMTLHSLTEGIGIGVSFGGKTGMQFGPFVSLSLALHNVPEGLAVALILTQRRVNVVRAGLWAVFTSLPQPLTAIPAFLFVEKFSKLLPIGLGFASGAMSYVAIFELLVESLNDMGIVNTGCVSLLSCLLMMGLQQGLKFML